MIPKLPLKILEKFVPPHLYESIEGDIVEQFDLDVETHGVSKARRKLFFNVIRFFRPGILLRNKFTLQLINAMMVGNYFKVAVRNIQKRKLYSLINAFGLSIGIAFCMLIWLFVQDELSFDQFHENKDHLYRVDARWYNYWDKDIAENERWNKQAVQPMGLLTAIKDECPEVVSGSRFFTERTVMTYHDKVFTEDHTYIDPDFLKMFSFNLLKGNALSVLSDKTNVLLTPDIAQKYFGEEDPIGKTVALSIQGKDKPFTVTGIIEAPPDNSSIDFKILTRMDVVPMYDFQLRMWGMAITSCFVQLRADADTIAFKQKLTDVRDKYIGPTIAKWKSDNKISSNQEILQYLPTPLTKIHFMKEVSWPKVSDIQNSYILGGIAGIIMLIASINYIALALTASASRRTEVGIRKVVGAVRKQLLYQFGLESVVLAMISLMAGLTLVAIFLPVFNRYTEKAISLDSTNILRFGIVGFLLALVVGIIAGSYPSIFLSRVRPMAVLKGGFTTRLQAGFTKPLVILQFSMSAFLIVSSVIMYRQMKFINTKDLGYNKDAVMVVSVRDSWSSKADVAYTQFRNEIDRWPEVESVAGTSNTFNHGYDIQAYKINEVNHQTYIYAIDQNYIPTLDIRLADGRNFDPSIASDSNALIVNEALMRDMGWKEFTDDLYLNWLGDSTNRGAKIIGVVKDYNFESLEQTIKPMLLTMSSKRAGHMGNALVRVSTTDLPSLVSKLEKTWHAIFPDKPFQYSFLDENVAKQYDKYERRMSIMGISTGFAILISCLGLFGLSGINAVNKTKEVGIRKVMGAATSNIFILLNKQYIWLSLIAFAIAIPCSWYVMKKWLDGFQFKIEMGWGLFAASIAAGLTVALITVSYHAIRISLINPAETLKEE